MEIDEGELGWKVSGILIRKFSWNVSYLTIIWHHLFLLDASICVT